MSQQFFFLLGQLINFLLMTAVIGSIFQIRLRFKKYLWFDQKQGKNIFGRNTLGVEFSFVIALWCCSCCCSCSSCGSSCCSSCRCCRCCLYRRLHVGVNWVALPVQVEEVGANAIGDVVEKGEHLNRKKSSVRFQLSYVRHYVTSTVNSSIKCIRK